MPAALAIQAAVTEQWCEQMDDSVGGWKCLLPPQDKLVVGPIYTRTIDSVPPVSLWPKNDRARIEPELAFFFGQDLPPRAEPYTPADVDAAVAAAKAALALVTSPTYSKAFSATPLADVSVGPHAAQTYAMILRFRLMRRFMARMPRSPSTWRQLVAPVKVPAQRRVPASAVATCVRVTARCARSKGSSLSNGHVQPVMAGARLLKTPAAPVRAKAARTNARP